MKRVLILALVLLACATLALQRSRRPRPAALEPLAAANSAAGRMDEAALESPTAVIETARAKLAADTDVAAAPEAPVAGALVRVEVLYVDSLRPVRSAKVFVGPPPTEGRTDEHGLVELRVPEGTRLYDVRVDAGDDGDPFVPYQRVLEQLVVPGGNEVVVRVDRGIDLRGSVREAATGRAVAGARVDYRGFGQRTRVETGADGSFVCTALLVNAGNAAPLNVEREGYLPASLKPQAADLDSGAAPLLVLLETGLVVSGRLLDSEHKPVGGAFLQLWTPAAFRATSDELGRFEFRGLAPSEHASIHAQSQSWSGTPILEKSLELGPLRASRFDLEFEVENAVEVRVFAELADGTRLESRRFEVDWGDGSIPRLGILEPPLLPSADAHVRVFPVGSEVDLSASARAPGTDARNAILRGSARVQTDRSVHSPLEVHIRLDEPGRLEIPPAPAGAAELELDEGASLRGALDVQVLDAESGQPIEGENRVLFCLHPAQPDYKWLSPGPGGWVRIWQRIGTREAFAGLDGTDEQVTLSIPRSGYAQTHWRLRTKP